MSSSGSTSCALEKLELSPRATLRIGDLERSIEPRSTIVKKSFEVIESEDAPCASTTLTVLETRVYHLAWQGMTHAEIARRIQRDPRTVSRMLTVIAQKIGVIDAGFLRLRLEAELLARIPNMSTRDLIAALKLYHSTPRIPVSEAAGATSNREVQSLLREVLPRGNADPASA